MKRRQASAFAHVLRRLLADDSIVAAVEAHSAVPEFTAKHREFFIGLGYRIRFELLRIQRGGNGLSKMAKYETAKKWGCTEKSVGTWASEHRAAIDAWFLRMEDSI